MLQELGQLRALLGVTGSLASGLARAAFARDPVSSTSEAGLRLAAATGRAALERLQVRLEVLEQDRVPRDGGVVFMWNQESHLDHLVLACALPRPFFTTFNNEVARVPFYGRHLFRTGHVHLDRNDESQWRPAIDRAAGRVRQGECALISPEGTRSRDGRLLPMKRGAFLLAARSGQPIVCATVIGGHQRMPRGSLLVRPGTLKVVFGEPIATAGGDPREGEQTALMEAVVSCFEETKRLHGQPGDPTMSR